MYNLYMGYTLFLVVYWLKRNRFKGHPLNFWVLGRVVWGFIFIIFQ